MITAAFLCAAAQSAPARADTPDSGVAGPWLRVPDFPDDAEVMEFSAEDEGEVNFARSIDDGKLIFLISRTPNPGNRITPSNVEEDFTRKLAEGGTETSGIQFDEDVEEIAAVIGSPVSSASFRTGEGEEQRENACLFVFHGPYLFTVAFSILTDSSEDYSRRIEGWIMGMKIVGAAAPGIVLLPKDADLSEAPGVLVEPDAAPFNLGGWRSGAVVIFNVTPPKAGRYAVSVVYSKKEADGDPGPLSVLVWHRGRKTQTDLRLTAQLPATGPEWDVYREEKLGTLELPEGTTPLALLSQTEADGKYVMNLRELRLAPEAAE
jgi:hypothetical protein